MLQEELYITLVLQKELYIILVLQEEMYITLVLQKEMYIILVLQEELYIILVLQEELYITLVLQKEMYIILVLQEELYICSKYGFCIIVPEGIMDLRFIIMLLVRMSWVDVLSVMSAGGVMCDVRHPRQGGGPLIGAGLRIYPPLELSATSWRGELGRGFHRRQT